METCTVHAVWSWVSTFPLLDHHKFDQPWRTSYGTIQIPHLTLIRPKDKDVLPSFKNLHRICNNYNFKKLWRCTTQILFTKQFIKTTTDISWLSIEVFTLPTAIQLFNSKDWILLLWDLDHYKITACTLPASSWQRLR